VALLSTRVYQLAEKLGMSNEELIAKLGEIDINVSNKNDVIVVYCQYGGRSRKAFIKLEKMGYINVYNLNGGIEGI
jgi:rhodanese-related sulfurtransferase